MLRLGHFAAIPPGVFEQREEVGHAQKGTKGRAEIDQFQPAATGSAGNVEGDECAQTRTVHEGDALKVEDDAFFVRKQSVNFVAKVWGVFRGQTAVTRNDGTWIRVAAARIHAKTAFRGWANFR